LWANLEHLRESYIEYCAQEHFDPEASEEESVASLDNQVHVYKLVYLLLLASTLFTLNPQVNKYATQVRSHNRWYSTSEHSTKISITNTRRRST